MGFGYQNVVRKSVALKSYSKMVTKYEKFKPDIEILFGYILLSLTKIFCRIYKNEQN